MGYSAIITSTVIISLINSTLLS